MKTTALITALLFSFNAFAVAPSQSSRINKAIELLSQGAEGGSSEYTFTSKGDAKDILKEIALSEQTIESADEFEDNYSTSGDQWEADSMTFGPATLSEVQDYVISALEQKLENAENTDAQKIKFANDYQAAKQGLTILKSLKDKVKFGVVPYGAVQCGVTFPSILVIDVQSGKATTISMEGSGC